MKRLIVLACLILGTMGAAPRQKRVPLRIVHVCVELPGGATDTVEFMSSERTARHPSPALARAVQNAVRGVTRNRADVDLMVAAESVMFDPEYILPHPKIQPIWGDDPYTPPAGFNCVCATAMYDGNKTFRGCTTDGCDGCMVCQAR